MTILTESVRNGEFVLTEGNGTFSRTQVTIAENQGALVSGTLIGKITASGQYAKYNNTHNDGTEVCAGVLYTGLKGSAAPQPAVIINRNAEVAKALLVGLDAAGEADLLAIGIVARSEPPALVTGTP